MIPLRICGIPAIAKVTHYFKQKPLGRYADSDMDCYGYEELEFDICDRRGRPAPWLVRKMTDKDWEKAEKEILEKMG